MTATATTWDTLAPPPPPQALPPFTADDAGDLAPPLSATDGLTQPVDPAKVTNDQFLEAIFGPCDSTAEAQPLVCQLDGDPSAAKAWPAKPWQAGKTAKAGANWYAQPSTFRATGGQWRAQKHAAAAVHAVMLDDVGTKVDSARLDACPPSWLLETSAGNFQAGYILAGPVTPKQADALKKALTAAGLNDDGATGGGARWMRLPHAINGKPSHTRGGKPWRCRLTAWHPERRYTLEELIEQLELAPAPDTDNSGRPKADGPRKAPVLASLDDEVHTPRPERSLVVEALKARGLYKRLLGPGKHDVSCPWVAEHTDGVDHGAAYFEPSDAFPIGGFKCQHSHGGVKRIGALLEFLGLSAEDARQRALIRVRAGDLDRIADAAELELAAAGRHYQRGGAIVALAQTPGTGDTAIRPETPASLTRELSRAAGWVRYDGRAQREVAIDPPARVVAALADAVSYRHLPPLAGLAHQPWLRPDGTVCARPGYDQQTAIFGTFTEPYAIPDRPTRADAQAALATLEGLLAEFAFATPADKAAALCGMLTATIRPSLPTAPMVLIAAPQPGSGKSYLAALIAGFATPATPRAASWPTSEEEASKLLLALFLSGPAAINFDNLTSDLAPLRAVCSALTESTLEGRVLGASKTANVSTRALLLASGNNVKAVADMARRTLTVALDPRIENPAGRRYKGDPVAALRADRARYVDAALTLIRAYVVCGERVNCQPLASFGDWSRWAREPLIWLGLVDPVAQMFEQIAHDPERELLGRVLTAWHGAFKTRPTTLREAIAKADAETCADAPSDLHGVLTELSDDPRTVALNARRIGRWIARHERRMVGGLRFERAVGNSAGERWAVREIAMENAK